MDLTRCNSDKFEIANNIMHLYIIGKILKQKNHEEEIKKKWF